MAFEVYTPRSRGKEKEPATAVKISKNSIVLNKPTRELLQQPEYLELAYDPETGTIRIRPAVKGEGSIQLKKTKVYAKGFLEHFDIKTYGKYFVNFKEDENALYIAL
jgi:hypothetical protein